MAIHQPPPAMPDPTPATATNDASAPDRFRRYLQAMPILAILSGLIATALHLYLGPSLPVGILAFITGSTTTLIILALHRNFSPMLPMAIIFFIAGTNHRQAIPEALADSLTQAHFTAHLLRYFTTLLTLHALTLLLFTHPTPRRQLNRPWQKLIEVPSRPE